MDNLKSSEVLESKENIPPHAPSSGPHKSYEAWKECNEVISLLQHRENIRIVQDVVHEIISCATHSPNQIYKEPATDRNRHHVGREMTGQIYHSTRSQEVVNGTAGLLKQPATVLEGAPEKVADEITHQPPMEPSHVEETASMVPKLQHSVLLEEHEETEAADVSVSVGTITHTNHLNIMADASASFSVLGERHEGSCKVAVDHADGSGGKFTLKNSFKQSTAMGSSLNPDSLCTPNARGVMECKSVMSPLALMMERLQISTLEQTPGFRGKGNVCGIPCLTNEVLSSETKPVDSVQENLVKQQPTNTDRRADASQDYSFLEMPEVGENLCNEHSLVSTTHHSSMEEMDVPSPDNTSTSHSPSLQKECFQSSILKDDSVAYEKSSDYKLFDNSSVHPKPQTTPKGSTASSSAQSTVFSQQVLRSPLQKDLSAPTTSVIRGNAAAKMPGAGDAAAQSLDSVPKPYCEDKPKVMPGTLQSMAQCIPRPPPAAQTLQESVAHETVDSEPADMQDRDLHNMGEQDFLSSDTLRRSPTKEIKLSDIVQSQATLVNDCRPQNPVSLEATSHNTRQAFVTENIFQLLVNGSTVAGSQKDFVRSSTPNRASLSEMNMTDTTSKILCTQTIPNAEHVFGNVQGTVNASGAPVMGDASCFADEENITDSTLNNTTVLERSSFLASNKGDSNHTKRHRSAGPVGVTGTETSKNSDGIVSKHTEKRVGTAEATDVQSIQGIHPSLEVPRDNKRSEENAREGAGRDVPDNAEHGSGDDSGVLSGAEAFSFSQAGGSEPEAVLSHSPLSARPAHEVDNVGPSCFELASPAARGTAHTLAGNIRKNACAVEAAAGETNVEARIVPYTLCNEKEEDGTRANGTERARPRQGRTAASQSSSVVKPGQKLRSPAKKMDLLTSDVGENASVRNWDTDASYTTAADTSPVMEDETCYFDAFSTTGFTPTQQAAQLQAAADEDCINSALSSAPGNFKNLTESAGVSYVSSPRLSKGTEVAEGDGNIFTLHSAPEDKEHSLALGSCEERPDSSENIMLCKKDLLGHRDQQVDCPVRASDVEQEPPPREAWEPSLNIIEDLYLEQEEGLTNEKEVVPAAPSDSTAQAALFLKDEFQCAVDYFEDPSAFDFLQKVGNNEHLKNSSLGRSSLYLKFDPLLSDHRKSFGGPLAAEEVSCSKEPVNHDMTLKQDALIDFHSSPSQKLVDISIASESVAVKAEEQMFSGTEMSQALQLQELMFQEQLLKKGFELCEEQKQAKARFEMQENAIRLMYQTIKELTTSCNTSSQEVLALKADKAEVTKERDQLTEDLRGLETAFSDFYRRYEQAKDMIRTMKENETILKKELKECHDMLQQKNEKIGELQTLVEKSTAKAKNAVEDVQKHADAEITVLKAQLKRAEMKNSSLERQLEDKTKENAQLTQMYDDLLNKVRLD